MGGIGGCPAAPGASGNIVTLVFLLEAMGLKTGIDFDRLIASRKFSIFSSVNLPDKS